MTALHVTDRPFPGIEPAPRPAPTRPSTALAGARRSLAQPAPCLPGCSLCECEWTWHDGLIGPCSVCLLPCSTTDPAGLPRHPSCTVGAAA